MSRRYTPDDVWMIVGAGVSGFCWDWQGYVCPAGYGRVKIDGRAHQAHRWTYQQLVGPIPDGLVLDHLCRNRRCCNPDHVEPVTDAENVRRGLLSYEIRTHCARGHDVRLEGAYFVARNGRRKCRVCHRENGRATDARQRAARQVAS